MACSDSCSSSGGWAYDSSNKKFYGSGSNCHISDRIDNQTCANTTNYAGENLSSCNICSICGGGTPYFTTNGSGVVTCYTGAGCGSACTGVPEPVSFLKSFENPFSLSGALVVAPTLVLVALVFRFSFRYFKR